MFEFIYALGSLFSFGCNSSIIKKSITDIGRHKSITYMYLTLITLLVLGAMLLNIKIELPLELVPDYIAEIVIGALGVIAAFKAIEYGKVSITSPVSKLYVLLVVAGGILLLGETLSTGQVMGSVIIVVAAILLSVNDKMQFKLEKWMIYLFISILCRAYYYTFIKTFVVVMGAYQTTMMLEIGVAVCVIGFHLLRGRDLSIESPNKMGFAIVSGIMCFFGTVLYSLSVGAIGAALTAAISAGSPIINTISARILVGEKLPLYKYIAIVLIAIGLIAILLF
ncbi:DMT family transporter [Candidatus Micrarchaeota archaeon]|nr:DMT family transporter [Candidatus Micrarchaeota archaeon]MBU1165531.1 DMT family transporter [Candidatus Micrarchaeota archaeon]MBU1886526.1 DMT family transporter [Candidatus Micrarchaeota archaeon]